MPSCTSPHSSPLLAIYSTSQPSSSPLIPPQPPTPPGCHSFHISPFEGPLPPLLPYNLGEEYPSPLLTNLSLPFDNPSSSYSSNSSSPAFVDSSLMNEIDQAQGNPHKNLSMMGFLFNGPHEALEAFINADRESRHQSKSKNVKGKAPSTNLRASQELYNSLLK
ncbi:hypothetical protein AMTR_s00059p00013360 [Amborella trichopoda]|uniref:POX domain-containing protein n=1 Tax=Amborella trichopoda TaxID=13333 RepID=U5DAM5_AMBTC|nr:hypothetical protein AMTR_s00059p00013360 [Amborella trichopoda]